MVVVSRPPLIAPYATDRYSGTKILWIMVIRRAMFDYVLWKDEQDVGKRRDADLVRKWLFEPSNLESSLANLCVALGLDIEMVRRKALELTRDEVKKIEFRERSREGRLLPATVYPDLENDEDDPG